MYMNLEIGTEATQFPFWGTFVANFRYSIFACGMFESRIDPNHGRKKLI
jgi:hypothetical protein